jgi:hypothetical protein
LGNQTLQINLRRGLFAFTRAFALWSARVPDNIRGISFNFHTPYPGTEYNLSQIPLARKIQIVYYDAHIRLADTADSFFSAICF